jgi:quinolinate synthase
MPADIFALRARYPQAPVIAHANSPASVKAMSDVCCTSANAVAIVNALEGDTVIMVPDQFLAQNVAKKTDKKIITWAGACEVHESFSPRDVAEMRQAFPDAKILAHPQCPPDVLEVADFSGASDELIEWVREARPTRVAMITECSTADNIAGAFPDVEFMRACNLCPHMKRITLENLLWSLHADKTAIEIDPAHQDPARAALERMLQLDGTVH